MTPSIQTRSSGPFEPSGPSFAAREYAATHTRVGELKSKRPPGVAASLANRRHSEIRQRFR
jgi:hypothetical protein